MNKLYPLKFKPVFKDKIWGGEKMRSVMGMDFDPLPNCGEAWMLSGVEGSQSTVSNGFLEGNALNEILEVYMYDLVGEEVYDKYGNEFPVLIKLIDANDWLSIQVHPDDDLARRRKIGRGKTEMWYVISADEASQLISGFNKPVSQGEFIQMLKSKRLPELLNYEQVETGDVFFIPAGRIHALGPGILLAEIQETSDTTYRIYDWDRKDSEGKGRELHLEESLDAIDFSVKDKYKTEYPRKSDKSVTLESCEHFTTNLMHLESYALEKDYSVLDSFIALLCVEGNCFLQHKDQRYTLESGELILIPAMMESILINPLAKTKILEVHM